MVQFIKATNVMSPCLVPPPSSDENSWWNTPGIFFFLSRVSRFSEPLLSKDCPAGVIPIAELEKLDLYRRKNPFDSSEDSSPVSSPFSSDEELYTHALSLPTPMEPVQASTRRPPPPPPR